MVHQTQNFHDYRLNHWVIIVSCQVLKSTVFIGTSSHGGTFTKEALEEIASYQDVCTPISSPLPPNLNRPKIMPNLFWIYTPVPTITLQKFANKSDNANFSFP
jgi:malic enzyme